MPLISPRMSARNETLRLKKPIQPFSAITVSMAKYEQRKPCFEDRIPVRLSPSSKTGDRGSNSGSVFTLPRSEGTLTI